MEEDKFVRMVMMSREKRETMKQEKYNRHKKDYDKLEQ